jgi:hypothetical protein
MEHSGELVMNNSFKNNALQIKTAEQQGKELHDQN